MKLLATDLDGTLLNSRHEISAENIAALAYARNRGAEIAVVTGRTYADASSVCAKAGLRAHIIANNGALVYGPGGNRLQAVTIAGHLLQPSLQWLHDNAYHYEASTATAVYVPAAVQDILEKDFTQARLVNPELQPDALDRMLSLIFSQQGVILVDSLEEIFADTAGYCNILGLSFDREKLAKGKEYFGQQAGLSLLSSNKYNFEVVNHTVSKGVALQYLIDYLGIGFSDVMAIGDNYNDLPMLRLAGVSVAMGNAEDPVKECCRHVSLSNDEHGVAHIIETLKDWF
ncbi:MAG TPA: Cof-type HAD-IIB family hydrolase [Selenomonadales bacterium]|nr:Cof-type HAD-IIB family hydrolase [Selenomonadales bacterium]